MIGDIVGESPFKANETITYSCAENYILRGEDENVCSGLPDHDWSLAESDLPSCLRSMTVYCINTFLSNQVFLLLSLQYAAEEIKIHQQNLIIVCFRI